MPPANQLPNQPPVISGAGSSTPQGSSANPQPLQKPKQNTTQNSLILSEIRDNMVIMADGSFRAVIACKSINFDLMSTREREGVEYSYQNFLNALNHPVQILIRSQRIDIGPYIDRLIQIRKNQDNMLLNVLMDDYINFIDILSQEANIMDKSFYIAIPYYPQGDITNIVEQGKGFFGKLMAKPKDPITKIDTMTYEKAKTEIKNRVDGVIASLFQIGVQSVQLDTKALGELYYNFYNPDTAVREPLGDFNSVTSTYVKKGGGPNPGEKQNG
jgi:type IV secretory pathway VirB4 component